MNISIALGERSLLTKRKNNPLRLCAYCKRNTWRRRHETKTAIAHQ
ncbi:hypothetical protein [Anabaena sp. CCY 9402-a]